MKQLHLISCNIEGERHLQPRVLPFLQSQSPDIVCLQEVFKCDVPDLVAAIGATHHYFATMTLVSQENPHVSPRGELGLGIFVRESGTNESRLENITFHHQFYFQPEGEAVPSFFKDENPNAVSRIVVWVECTWQGQQYCVATTHFTWSPGGSFTDEQARDYQNLLAVTQQLPPHILCGDFNSPRRPEESNVFAELSWRYVDTIPAHYTTSLDENLHKAGKLELMVDGLFAHPVYQVERVEIVPNVSDHMALSGWVGRR